MAVDKGFEPLMLFYSSVIVYFHIPALEAGAINHSANLPLVARKNAPVEESRRRKRLLLH